MPIMDYSNYSLLFQDEPLLNILDGDNVEVTRSFIGSIPRNVMVTKSVRFDGRELLAYRVVSIQNGFLTKSHGSALVKLGNTVIVSGAYISLEKMSKSLFEVCIKAPKFCEVTSEGHSTLEKCRELGFLFTRFIENTFIDKKRFLLLNTNDIYLHVIVKMQCLNNDGNLFDACFMALMASLKSLKVPTVYWESGIFNMNVDSSTIDVSILQEFVGSDKKVFVPENTILFRDNLFQTRPLSFIVICENREAVLVDPSLGEEKLMGQKVSLLLDHNNEVLFLNISSGDPIHIQKIDKIVDNLRHLPPLFSI